MKLPLSLLPIGLLLSVPVQVNAADADQHAQNRDTWFETPATESSDPYEAPLTEPRVAPPRASQPDAARPAMPQPPRYRRRAAPTVPIRFEPDDPSVHLLVQEGMMPFESVVRYDWPGWWGGPYGYYRGTGVAPIYNPLCEGQCTTQVRRGPHQFALSKPGGPLVPVAGQVLITQPSLIRARYVDRSDLRTAGVLVGVIGSLGGLIMMVLSVHDEQDCGGNTCTTRTGVDDALAATGLGVFAGSIITSAVLLNQRDAGQLSIMPLRLAAPGLSFDASGWNQRQSRSEGASLALRF